MEYVRIIFIHTIPTYHTTPIILPMEVAVSRAQTFLICMAHLISSIGDRYFAQFVFLPSQCFYYGVCNLFAFRCFVEAFNGQTFFNLSNVISMVDKESELFPCFA